jgi:hypothetical protein
MMNPHTTQQQHQPTNTPEPTRMLPDGTLEIHINTTHRRPSQQKPAGASNPPLAKILASAARGIAAKKPWSTVTLRADPFFETFLHNAPTVLPNVGTRQAYTRSLTLLRQLNQGLPIKELVLPTPEAMLRRLMDAARQYELSPWTVKGMLTALQSLLQTVLSDNAKAKAVVKAAIQQLKNAHRKAKGADTHQLKSADGWVTYKQLCCCRDAIQEDTQPKLLMAFITMLPRISDLACCRIFARDPGSTDTCGSSSCLVLPPPNATTNSKAYIVYLGASRAARTTLPPRLEALIRCSLEHTPRERLFTYTTARSGNQPSPYTTRSFNAWCAKAVRKGGAQRRCNPAASLKLCMHAFITEYLADPRTAKRKAKVLADILGRRVGWVLKQRCTIKSADGCV